MTQEEVLNELLVRLFNRIMDIEHAAVITGEFQDITINDMHILECVGSKQVKNMSSIARDLDITVGTLTISMNALVKKGYVNRMRGQQDKRVVYISLTEKGERAFRHHAAFHEDMIRSVTADMDKREMEVLIQALQKLTGYFKERYQ